MPEHAELNVVSLHAWFGQLQEYAATRQRILASTGGTGEVTPSDCVAKACSIVPSSDRAELEAVLALGRKAVELRNVGRLREWCHMALGMAEYPRRNYFEADQPLLGAVEARPTNALVIRQDEATPCRRAKPDGTRGSPQHSQ